MWLFRTAENKCAWNKISIILRLMHWLDCILSFIGIIKHDLISANR